MSWKEMEKGFLLIFAYEPMKPPVALISWLFCKRIIADWGSGVPNVLKNKLKRIKRSFRVMAPVYDKMWNTSFKVS